MIRALFTGKLCIKHSKTLIRLSCIYAEISNKGKNKQKKASHEHSDSSKQGLIKQTSAQPDRTVWSLHFFFFFYKICYKMCPKLKSSPHTSRACCLLVPTFEGHSWCIHCGPSVYYNLSLSHIYIYCMCGALRWYLAAHKFGDFVLFSRCLSHWGLSLCWWSVFKTL